MMVEKTAEKSLGFSMPIGRNKNYTPNIFMIREI